MRIRLSLALDITRERKVEAVDDIPPGALNDNDGTLVEHAGPQRMGFAVPTSVPPLDPDGGR